MSEDFSELLKESSIVCPFNKLLQIFTMNFKASGSLDLSCTVITQENPADNKTFPISCESHPFTITIWEY